MLSDCRATHLQVPLLILACAMYMVTGKYTVSGQKAIAPSKPRTALKKGNIIATKVVKTTKTERRTSLQRVNWKERDLLNGNRNV